MIVKTFTGSSLRDALRKVRDAFGPDAVILDTRFPRAVNNRLAGARGAVEVTAACEPPNPGAGTSLPSSTEDSRESVKTLHLKRGGEPRSEQDEVFPTPTDTAPSRPMEDATVLMPSALGTLPTDDLKATIRTLRNLVSETRWQNSADRVWPSFRRWLSRQPKLAAEILETYAVHLVQSLPPFEPFLKGRMKGQACLFVGERGAGKSVALFKALAARWQIRQQRPLLKVFSETVDESRRQLVSWCEDSGVDLSFHSVNDKKLSVEPVPRGRDCFAEYIPAAGDAQRMQKSAKVIRRALKPDVVVLVLNAGGAPRAWEKAVERFAPFAPTHVIFTHWDQHQPWWEMVSFLHGKTLTPTYRTCGFEPFDEIDPMVETDIRAGLADDLLLLMAGSESTHDVDGGKR